MTITSAIRGERRVRWLDEIPKSWRVVPSKWLFALSTQRALPDDEQLTASQDDGVIPQAEFERRAGRQVMRVFLNREILKHVEQDDFVISMRSFQGGLERSWARGCISSAYVVLKPSKEVHVPFFAHLFKSGAYIQALQATSNLVRDGQALRYDNFAMVYLPRVPMDEQSAIADFLDRKTTAIDALIEKKERLVALLAEQRAALIHRAVTRGLDPDVEMKDSGVEWIGEVPAHWAVKRVKNELTNLNARRIPLSTLERAERQGPFPYYGASSVIDHVEDYLFDETTILIAEDGANLVLRNLPLALIATGKYWVNNHAHILRPSDGAFQFWAAVLESKDYKPFISGSAQPKLTAEALGNVPVACPPDPRERIAIGEHVEEIALRIDRSRAAVRTQVERLREYRQALITAAVTGQLDITRDEPVP